MRRARQQGDPNSQTPNLRYILLNMVEQYAWHNGHADLIREAIDATGEALRVNLAINERQRNNIAEAKLLQHAHAALAAYCR